MFLLTVTTVSEFDMPFLVGLHSSGSVMECPFGNRGLFSSSIISTISEIYHISYGSKEKSKLCIRHFACCIQTLQLKNIFRVKSHVNESPYEGGKVFAANHLISNSAGLALINISVAYNIQGVYNFLSINACLIRKCHIENHKKLYKFIYCDSLLLGKNHFLKSFQISKSENTIFSFSPPPSIEGKESFRHIFFAHSNSKFSVLATGHTFSCQKLAGE